ncbi:hypothetical protein [Luteitalea sp.]|jgi:hypothetical protein|uniref:hypothetical protein n=1 Tax=Luteitalea sp. TaxID=2004800 RepID=UPI0037CC49AB
MTAILVMTGAPVLGQTTERVSLSATGTQAIGGNYTPRPSISADGTVVAFESPLSTLVTGDTNYLSDIFVVAGGTVTRVNALSGAQPNCASSGASVSATGQFVVFDSCASNLVVSDTNNAADVFLLDRNTGTVTRVSVSSAGAQGATGMDSYAAAISPNGRYVAFLSLAGWDGGSIGLTQTYLRDLVTGSTYLVSRANGGSSTVGQSDARPSVADDGSVAFVSSTSGLVSGDTNGVSDVFIRRNPTTGSSTERVSLSSTNRQLTAASTHPSISADGLRVVFETTAAAVPTDTNTLSDVYMRDRSAGATVLVSRTASGNGGNGASQDGEISANGTFVSFTSQAADIAGTFDALFDVFRASVSAGAPATVSGLTRLSVSTGTTTLHSGGSDVADSGVVAFHSDEPLLVSNDLNGDTDVFTSNGTVITRHTFPATGLPESYSGQTIRPAPSYDGSIVAFLSSTTQLVSGDTNSKTDVFVRNRTTGATTRLPVPVGYESLDADWVTISHDGRFVAYSRGAAFVFDRVNGTTTLVSTATPGGTPVSGGQPRISASGRYVAYLTAAAFDVADTNGLNDVYRWDRLTGTQVLVSRGVAGANGGSAAAGISGDGNLVSFVSGATNLATDGSTDTNGRADVFVRNVTAGTTLRVSAGLDATAGVFMRDPFISADGSTVTFLGSASQQSEATTVASDVYVVKSNGTGLRGPLSGPTEGVGGSGGAFDPTISMYGRFLVFRSYATDLGVTDTNAAADVYARQILGTPGASTFGAAQRISVAGGGTQGTGGTGLDSENPEIIGTGKTVVFQSGFGNLVADDTNYIVDAFARGGVFGNGECDYIPSNYVAFAQQNLLDPCTNNGSPWADPDGDGVTNEEESNGGGDGNPVLGTYTRYFAEGATKTAGLNFDTRIALANPSADTVTGVISYQLPSGAQVPTTPFTLGPYERKTVLLDEQDGIAETGPAASYEFSTTVKATAPVGVDRTMTWDKSTYSGHAETGVVSASRKWYFAEGATIGGFNLFYLLQNPSAAPVTVEGRFLLGTGAVHAKTYTLPPNSRFNVWANVETINGATPLANAELSAEFTVTAGAAIIAERAMYRGANPLFKAGHESAGVTELSTEWFLAEGNAGAFFDEFVLIGNTTPNAALVQADFVVGNTGTIYSKQYTVQPNSRFNIWVDEEELAPGVFPFRTGNTDVSVRIRSLNLVPLIVERAMWWPGSSSTWYEAHNSPGATRTANRWVVAEGENGGALGWNTYILVANTGTGAGSIRMRVLGTNGQTGVISGVALAAQSRTTFFLGDLLTAAGLPANSQAGVLIESETGSLPLVVERAMYRNVNGVTFQVGTNALGTPLP